MVRSSSEHHSPYAGVVIPMVTPLTDAGELDESAVRRLVDHFVSAGIDGIFVAGTTGEEASMPRPMRERLARLTVRLLHGRARTYAGISDGCLRTSVELAHAYFEMGVDVVVAKLPSCYALDEEEQSSYFETLAQQVAGPLMLYNITATTHMTITLGVVQALSTVQNIVGIKDSDRDPHRFVELVHTVGQQPGFAVFAGASALWGHGLRSGADGFVPGVGNLVPTLCTRLYKSIVQPEPETALATEAMLGQLSEILGADRTVGERLGALKVAMSVHDLCGPAMLPPLRTPAAPVRENIRHESLAWFNRHGLSAVEPATY